MKSIPKIACANLPADAHNPLWYMGSSGSIQTAGDPQLKSNTALRH